MTGTDRRVAAAIELHRAGRLDEAEKAYRAILETVPDHPGVLHNLGIVAAQSDRLEEAVDLFDRALAADPNYASAHLNKGAALRDMGLFEQAIASYEAALALELNDPRAQFGAGEALRGLGRLEEASDRYARAIGYYPDQYEAHLARALALTAMERRTDAMIHFRRTSRIRRDAGYIGSGRSAPNMTTKRKLRHDIGLFRHVAARNGPGDGAHAVALAEKHQAVMDKVDWPDDPDAPVVIPEAAFAPIADSYNRPVLIADAPEIAGSTLNPALNPTEIARRYHGNAPGVAWFDGLLSAQARGALKRFLLESAIWHDFTHIPGFLAAYLEDGLACPLLLQITADLRRAFPDILGPHPLSQGWAFKCLTGDKGIDIHADAAAVSVNFWVTRDDANRDPDAGGLAIYKALPPKDWRLENYDADIGPIRDFLAESGGDREIIPYRENRAVIFKSDLFHESGAVAFKPGYENHRINITLLFGERNGAIR